MIAALKVLAQNSNGFVAMIEGAAIDKQLHLMDTERFILDTIEFDRAIEVCLRFAQQNEKDTLVIVTADHECGGAHVIGSSKLTHADLAGRLLNGSSGLSGFRNGVVGTLESAGFPKYQIAADGYPINIDIDYRPLVGYACNADRYEDWLTNPYPVANSSHSTVNTKWYTISPPFPTGPMQRDLSGFLVTGQIADAIATHTATDVVVSAFGRGASKFRGQIDNTDVFFKVMEAALGDVNPGHDKLKE